MIGRRRPWIELHVRGGIAAIDRRVVVERDGTVIVTQGRGESTGELDGRALEVLEAATSELPTRGRLSPWGWLARLIGPADALQQVLLVDGRRVVEPVGSEARGLVEEIVVNAGASAKAAAAAR